MSAPWNSYRPVGCLPVEAVDSIVAATEGIDEETPLTSERQLESLAALYSQLTATLSEVGQGASSACPCQGASNSWTT